MKNILVLVFFGVVGVMTSACKLQGNNNDDIPLKLEFGGVQVNSKRTLDKGEREIATRICAATELKRKLFKTYDDESVKLEFKGEQRNCGAEYTSELAPHEVAIANDINFINPEFTAYNLKNIFNHIIFDNDHILAPICDALNARGEVWNFHESDYFKYAINFKSSKAQDIIEWLVITKSAQGQNEFISEANVAWINTDLNSYEPRSVGLEISRQRVLVCAQEKVSFLKKDYLKFK